MEEMKDVCINLKFTRSEFVLPEKELVEVIKNKLDVALRSVVDYVMMEREKMKGGS